MKNPTEELTGHILFTLVVGYFAALNMTCFLSPIGALRHFPRRRKRVLFYCLCERSEAGSTARPPFGALMRATSPVSSGESTPGRVSFRKAYISLFGRGIFRCAQYDVKSPIGALRHFAYAADAPLLSLSRHFPRFSGGIYPEGGSKKRADCNFAVGA